MTIDDLKPHELEKLWAWVSAEPQAHMDDAGPKTLEAFVEHLANEKITVFAIRTGKKLVGAVGFQVHSSMLKGIHFIPEVRGSGLPRRGVDAVLHMLGGFGVPSVSVAWYASNARMTRFVQKLGGEITREAGKTIRAGEEVALHVAHFTL